MSNDYKPEQPSEPSSKRPTEHTFDPPNPGESAGDYWRRVAKIVPVTDEN